MQFNALLQINIPDILKDLGIEYQHAGPKNLRIRCFNPDHVERNPSMSIHIETGIIFCFGCQEKGNLFTLLHSKGFDFEESKHYLKKFVRGGNSDEEVRKFLEDFVNAREATLAESDNKEIKFPDHCLLDSHPYLIENRGLTSTEIQEWKMGSVTDITNIEFRKYFGWIYIPIYKNHVLRNYFLRSTFGNGKEDEGNPVLLRCRSNVGYVHTMG